tara:strand:- start:160 stop:450 length:291 start_codon:yes stop_codon:yes gene_type:complete
MDVFLTFVFLADVEVQIILIIIIIILIKRGMVCVPLVVTVLALTIWIITMLKIIIICGAGIPKRAMLPHGILIHQISLIIMEKIAIARGIAVAEFR